MGQGGRKDGRWIQDEGEPNQSGTLGRELELTRMDCSLCEPRLLLALLWVRIWSPAEAGPT